MTQVPYLGIRTVPRDRSSREPWESYVRSEFPGHDTSWFLAAATSGASPAPLRPSWFARAALRLEALEHRAFRALVPGLATEISLPSHPRHVDADCDGDPCTEALKDRTAMGPR